MQTIYNYLSEAGWAWFAVVAIYLTIRLGWRKMHRQVTTPTSVLRYSEEPGSISENPGSSEYLRTGVIQPLTEADEPHEQ